MRELRLADPGCSRGVNTAAGETNIKAGVSCNHTSKSTKMLLIASITDDTDWCVSLWSDWTDVSRLENVIPDFCSRCQMRRPTFSQLHNAGKVQCQQLKLLKWWHQSPPKTKSRQFVMDRKGESQTARDVYLDPRRHRLNYKLMTTFHWLDVDQKVKLSHFCLYSLKFAFGGFTKLSSMNLISLIWK